VLDKSPSLFSVYRAMLLHNLNTK